MQSFKEMHTLPLLKMSSFVYYQLIEVHVRELALHRIAKASAGNKGGIRKLLIPLINFDFTDYNDLTHWHDVKLTESSMTMHISDDKLQQFIKQAKGYI